MIENIYTIKSFLCLGKSLTRCYGCDYCRANDDASYDFETLPGKVNPLFRQLPVAINIFYGDPVLQWDRTMKLLKRLEEDGHTGPIVIITKGKMPSIPYMDIDLHVGITIGPDEVSRDNFEENLNTCRNDSWYLYSIEYRPICNDINDSYEWADYVFSLAKQHHALVAYSGLQLPPNGLPDKYKPYDGRPFSMQKYISEDVRKRLLSVSRKYSVPMFQKTSCLISYTRLYDRDYNAHYLKPDGVGCRTCIMHEKCMKFTPKEIELPFEYSIHKESMYRCSFVRNGLCKFPNKECLGMEGYFIRPKVKELTRGDARIIKWLTGCMVDGDMKLIETPYISNFWNNV